MQTRGTDTPHIEVYSCGFYLVGTRRRAEGGWIAERKPVPFFVFLSNQPKAANA